MSDTLLWSLAIGVGAVGLLLLAVAGVAAMLLGSKLHSDAVGPQRRPGSEERVDPTGTSQPQGGKRIEDQAADTQSADESTRARTSGGLLLAWLKAWVFAFIHAGAVSFVLGGMTFFEDLVRANEEIQSTGTVNFPKRLLPGAFSGPEPSRSLAHGPDENASEDGRYGRYRAGGQAYMGRDRPTISTAETAEWTVVDILDEAGPDGEALAGGYHPGE